LEAKFIEGFSKNQSMIDSRLKITILAIILGLCLFITCYFLIVIRTSIIYTQLFYIPTILACAWWGRKGIAVTFSIISFLLGINFLFAPNISLVDNLVRSVILLTVSIITSALFVSRRKTEAKLDSIKMFNENVVNSVGDALLVIDPNDFRIISANNAAMKQLKASKDDLIGKTCYQVTHHRSTPCEPPYDICPIHEMLTIDQPVTVEHQHFDLEKRRIDVEVSVHPVKDKDGKIVQVVHIDRDITVRKEQERAERTKSNEIQGIVEGIGDLLFVIDNNRIITKVNKATCDIFKKTPEELIGRHCYEIVHNTDVPWCNCPASKTFETKQIVTEEVDDPNLGIPLLVTTSPVLDEQGKVAHIIHIAKDITKMKEAEMEVHIAANLFGAASDSILVHELDGKLVYFNEAAYTTRGYTKDEFQTLTIRDLEVPENPRFFGTRMNELVKKGEATFEAYNLRKDKTVLPVEIHAQVIESDGRKLVLSVARDISERKAAEEKLAESQEKYETSFESSMDALMLLDEKSFLDCNVESLHLFGFNSVEEFSKKHPSDLSPTFQPDGLSSLESANNHIKKALWSGRDNFFWVHQRADGTTFPADVLLSRITLKNRVILQATVRNVTEQKEAEEKLRESSHRIEVMNEKLRVVGGLTRHDVRNKLSTVTGYAYILKKKHGDLADVVDGLSRMEQAVAESVRIFDFAKMYEQLGVEDLTYVDVEAKLNEAYTLFSGALPTIVNECHGLSVLADSFLMQLFYNFVDNTRKYGKKTTTIRVHFEKADQGSLKLIYEDDGVGIPLENKPSLFKEGFSTGGSTGFGLFLTKKMIDVYGWTIEENGEPGIGAKFTITIPRFNKSGKENYKIFQ
jgi:PAS domain S-box-containing protein